MHDQANQLRHLVQQEAHLAASGSADHPKLVAMTGGKGGVGTTTLAVNLAVALAQSGRRTALVDADLDGGDASPMCRVEERYTINDVLSARRTVREALQSGPGGIQVLPGAWGLATPPDDSPPARERLIEGLQGLGSQFEFVIVDAGNGLRPLVRSVWDASDMVLAVSTVEPAAVMDTYASIKALSAGNVLVPVHVVLNQVTDEQAAEEARARIASACLRFLALPVTRAGQVESDPQWAACVREGKTPLLAAPECPASRNMMQLGQFVAGQEENRNRPPAARVRRAEPSAVAMDVQYDKEFAQTR